MTRGARRRPRSRASLHCPGRDARASGCSATTSWGTRATSPARGSPTHRPDGRDRGARARGTSGGRRRGERSRPPSPRGGSHGLRRTSRRRSACEGARGQFRRLLACPSMDAAQALADLTEISSQIQAAVLFDESGAVQGSTLGDAEAAEALAGAAAQLLARVDDLARDAAAVTQLEAATDDGSVFVVRDGVRRIAATTGAAPTVGLVFYDLKSCLRGAAEEPAKPKRTRRKKAKEDDAA